MSSSTLRPVRLRAGVRRGDRAAVFLDRDGVLNEVTGTGDASIPPRSTDDVVITSDARLAVSRLRDAGFVLIVVTNQPDVARGQQSRDGALAITEHVVDELGLDDAYLCLHDGPAGCNCRKPEPGLIEAAARDWSIARARSWLIGDRWVDIGAARAAGVRAVLLQRAYSMRPSGGVEAPSELADGPRAPTLAECVDVVLVTP